MAVVLFANAVVEPRAVMVESFYAAITDPAVFNLVSHVEVADVASES